METLIKKNDCRGGQTQILGWCTMSCVGHLCWTKVKVCGAWVCASWPAEYDNYTSNVLDGYVVCFVSGLEGQIIGAACYRFWNRSVYPMLYTGYHEGRHWMILGCMKERDQVHACCKGDFVFTRYMHDSRWFCFCFFLYMLLCFWVIVYFCFWYALFHCWF